MSKHTSQAFTHGTPFVSRFISLRIVLWPPFVLRSELRAREVFDLVQVYQNAESGRTVQTSRSLSLPVPPARGRDP